MQILLGGEDIIVEGYHCLLWCTSMDNIDAFLDKGVRGQCRHPNVASDS